jgi:predicted peroxiredoxin
MWANDSESKILYVQTHGVADPGRSATPFFLAAAAAAMESEVMIYFTMYGPTLLRKDVIDTIGPKGSEGEPLRYFIEQATSLGVRLLVCQSR